MQSEISGRFIILEQEKTSLRNLAEKILELKNQNFRFPINELVTHLLKVELDPSKKQKKDINFIAETKLEYGLEKLMNGMKKN